MFKHICTVTKNRNEFELTIYRESGFETVTVKTVSKLMDKLVKTHLPIIFSPHAIKYLSELLSPNLDLT